MAVVRLHNEARIQTNALQHILALDFRFGIVGQVTHGNPHKLIRLAFVKYPQSPTCLLDIAHYEYSPAEDMYFSPPTRIDIQGYPIRERVIMTLDDLVCLKEFFQQVKGDRGRHSSSRYYVPRPGLDFYWASSSTSTGTFQIAIVLIYGVSCIVSLPFDLCEIISEHIFDEIYAFLPNDNDDFLFEESDEEEIDLAVSAG